MTTRFAATAALLFLIGSVACRESTPAPRSVAAPPVGAASAFLELVTPPDLPGHVTMRVRLRGATVASFTGSVTYDPSRLRFLGDASAGGTVVVNGEGVGLVRLAGFHTEGFPDELLASLTFERRGASVGAPLLGFTQATATDGSDLAATRILPPAVTEGR
jgi:hypothetical protein